MEKYRWNAERTVAGWSAEVKDKVSCNTLPHYAFNELLQKYPRRGGEGCRRYS